MTDICGSLPGLLFSVSLLQVLRFPLTVIRQVDNGLWDGGWQGCDQLKVCPVMVIKHHKSLN